MIISELQKNNKKEEFINELLKNSVVPTSVLVNRYIKEDVETKMLGVPDFKPTNIKSYSKSNSKSWNKNFKNLQTDLNLLYQSYNLLNDDILNCEELYLNEKDNIFDKFNKISLMIENINENLKNNSNIYSYVQIFNNLYTCELEGDLSRNIPKSNSFVDLINKNVKNDKVSLVNSKINITKSTIELNSNKIDPSSVLGDISNILTDETNEFYYVSFNKDTKDKTFSVSLQVTLPTPKYFSSIAFECVSPSPYVAKLSLSSDNTNYQESYEITSTIGCEWMFESQEVSSFTITIEKKTSDAVNDDGNLYYYIFKNLSCINEVYELSSTYVSNPITLNSIVDNVMLCVNNNLLPSTNIDYFIGIDNGNNIIEWKQLFNNQWDSLNIFKKREKILNNSLSEYGEYVGNDCYVVYKLPKDFSKSDMMLLYGYQMWKLETLNIPENVEPKKYVPDILDYTDYYVQRKFLVDTEEYEFSIKNAKTHIMSQYIYCDKECYVRDRNIKALDGIQSNLKHKVYVNNVDIKSFDGNYNFTLKKGLNVVHIMMYVQDSSDTAFTKISHNFNFKEYSFDIFAAKPMKYLNNKKLRFNGLKPNNKYYSIEDNLLIVKDDMNMINEHVQLPNQRTDMNYKNHSRYLLKFKQLNSDKAHLVSVNNNTTTVRVMANLKSNNPSYSPQINSFRLLGR